MPLLHKLLPFLYGCHLYLLLSTGPFFLTLENKTSIRFLKFFARLTEWPRRRSLDERSCNLNNQYLTTHTFTWSVLHWIFTIESNCLTYILLHVPVEHKPIIKFIETFSFPPIYFHWFGKSRKHQSQKQPQFTQHWMGLYPKTAFYMRYIQSNQCHRFLF